MTDVLAKLDAVRRSVKMSSPFRKRSKYNAVRVTIDGFNFASKREGAYYVGLRQLAKVGEIRNLICQFPFELYAAGLDGHSIRIGSYLCDFAYFDLRDNKQHFVDVKGVSTPVFKLKAKIVKANHGVEIEVVK